MNFRIAGIPGLMLYLGVGALMHLIVVGPTFVWDSAWTWILLFGWPLIVVPVLFLALGVVGLALTAWMILLGRRERAHRARRWETW